MGRGEFLRMSMEEPNTEGPVYVKTPSMKPCITYLGNYKYYGIAEGKVMVFVLS